MSYSIHQSLIQAIAGLRFSPQSKRTVLRLESKPTLWKQIREKLFSNSLRLIGAGSALLCIGVLVVAIQFHHRVDHSAQQHANMETERTYVVDVPVQTVTHLFQRENNTVVDALVADVSVGYAGSAEIDER
jgi:hypothetical protein